MNFTMSNRPVHWRDRMVVFMDEHLTPAVAGSNAQIKAIARIECGKAPKVCASA